MHAPIVLEKLPSRHGGFEQGGEKFRKKRVYIFLTQQGFIFTCMLPAMLLGAVNYNNSMAYILTFLLASLFMVCMLHTYRNLRGLIIRTSPARPVFAGENICFPLLIDNRTAYDRIAIDLLLDKERKKKTPEHTQAKPLTFNLSSTGTSQEHLFITTSRRGLLYPGRLRISSSYPLGLFYAWSYMDIEQTGIVYPRPSGNVEFPISSDHDAEEQTGKHTGTDDFIGFKPYQPSDSVRNIDWKKYAREQGLLVKRFSGSGSRKLLLQWQQCRHLHDVEKQLSQLCLWVIEAEKQGLHYGLEIPGICIELNHGVAHKHQCLKVLAEYGLADNNH